MRDHQGAIWAGTDKGLLRLANNHWDEIGKAWNFPGKIARALFVDRAGTLWVATQDSIVFLPSGRSTFRRTGIHVIQVPQIAQAPNGRLWIAQTSRSVRPMPLPSKLAPPNNTEIRVGSQAILFARDGSLWISTLGDGIRRILDPDRLKGKPGRFSRSIESYASQDGIAYNFDLTIYQDRDGNIWVGTMEGIDRFHPPPSATRQLQLLPRVAPPASIQSIVADGRTWLHWTHLALPAGTRNLQINYGAASLNDPGQVHFRYKLEGVDSQWQDAGTRRTAFYMNLHPGKYEFHVASGITDSAWNPAAVAVSFTIPAFWFQLIWLRALTISVFLLILWTLYRLRMSQVERRFSLALETRLDERARIARELHDTLLQSFHGLLFQFQAARNMLPRKTEAAMQVIDKAILATEQAIAEGRDAIRDLRPNSASERDLAGLFGAAGQEMVGVYSVDGPPPAFRVLVEGRPRKLAPPLQSEIYRIGREVIRNAFHHAAASHIEVELLYDERQLRLRIRDDGKGIDSGHLQASGRPGHWGLPGIRERAQQIGSQLEVWSQPGAGTEVELDVPAAVVYEKQRDSHRFRLFNRGGNRADRS
ncbi:MAG: two-component regulator propeller domain-containing protein [Acidobacteriaceae bacterium]